MAETSTAMQIKSANILFFIISLLSEGVISSIIA
jgi:hypothetical protein